MSGVRGFRVIYVLRVAHALEIPSCKRGRRLGRRVLFFVRFCLRSQCSPLNVPLIHVGASNRLSSELSQLRVGSFEACEVYTRR